MVKTRRASKMENKKNNINIKRVFEVKILLKKENIDLYKTTKISKKETAASMTTSTTTSTHNLRTRREGKYKFRTLKIHV